MSSETGCALAAAARDGTLPPDDMTGGTFTVTNLGMFDVEAFSAIINPGESAILAVAPALPTPVAIEGGIAIRSIMRLTCRPITAPLTASWGHGSLGPSGRRLEDPSSLPLASANG